MREKAESEGDLTLLALLYTGDELDEQEKAAFEQRLGHDQAARDALAQAVQVSLLLTSSAPGPAPAYREKVRQRLRPCWWRRLAGRRSYRGHPLLWGGLGAAAAALVLLTWGQSFVFSTPQAVRETIVLRASEPAPEAAPVPVGKDVAQVWAELHNHEHLSRAVAEERRRRDRAEERRQTHTQERRWRRSGHPAAKQ
jgi:hypothetical protein